MKHYALTGGIGSGKSTVLSLFKEMGVPTFSADDSAKHALRSIDETKLLAEAVFEKTSSGQLSVYVTGLPKSAKKLTISPPTVSYLTVE
mgnify:CR=1 FL=1